MQTQLWCARCGRFVEFELKLKKMRGRTQLAQLLSVCPRCRSTLHTQTMRLQAAQEALQKFEEARSIAQEEVAESGADEEASQTKEQANRSEE